MLLLLMLHTNLKAHTISPSKHCGLWIIDFRLKNSYTIFIIIKKSFINYNILLCVKNNYLL